MKIIRCTQKLIKELKVNPCENASASSWLASWHANIFRIDRKNCLLVTNDKTLYSIFLFGLKKADFLNLPFILNEHLFKSLLSDGLSQDLIEKVLSVGDEVIFTKTNSRSVLGSMNDFKQCLECHILARGGFENGGGAKAQDLINRMPAGALNYQFPIDAFIEELKRGGSNV